VRQNEGMQQNRGMKEGASRVDLQKSITANNLVDKNINKNND
jgi:hypothetical protein